VILIVVIGKMYRIYFPLNSGYQIIKSFFELFLKSFANKFGVIKKRINFAAPIERKDREGGRLGKRKFFVSLNRKSLER
jgi:hypothetical protein